MDNQENNSQEINAMQIIKPRYAGFWIRLVAFIIDCFVYGIIYYIIIFLSHLITDIFWSKTLYSDVSYMVANNDINYFDRVISLNTIGSLLIIFALWWLYNSLMESSPLQATLGKRIFKLKITDLNGNKISRWRADGRFVLKFISIFLIFFIWTIIVFLKPIHWACLGCEESTPSLYENVINFLSSAVPAVLILVLSLVTALSKKKQSLHDKIAKTLVVYE